MGEVPASVIVNNRNYATFLGQAIDSALAQDLPGVEVIVVDDGSTDDSRAVIAGYGARVVPVLKDNGGQGSAFNAGLRLARGRVVNFLDADDTLSPDAAARAVAALSGDPGAVQWLAPLTLVDAEGRSLGALFPARPLPDGTMVDRALAYGPWSYQTVPTTGNWWARWYLEAVMPIPEARFRIAADEYLSAMAALHGRLRSSSQPAGWYRVHGRNVYFRDELTVQDLAEDEFNFTRIAGLLVEHAGRLGLPVDPGLWVVRDWRQQVRHLALHLAGRAAEAPGGFAVLRAGLLDQTAPAKKLALLPLLALLLALPSRPALGLALKLLRRR